MTGRFEGNEFISPYGSGISKESNSLSFNENVFASCIEEGNISSPNLVPFPDAVRLYH